MNKRLYVGNLQWEVTDSKLKSHFELVGEVESASVILDRNTGRSRGFGFVEMIDEKDAEKVIEELSGSDLEGRKIIIRKAQPENANPLTREIVQSIGDYLLSDESDPITIVMDKGSIEIKKIV